MLGAGSAGSGSCAAHGKLANSDAASRPAAKISPDRCAFVTPLDALLAIRLKAGRASAEHTGLWKSTSTGERSARFDSQRRKASRKETRIRFVRKCSKRSP